MTIAKLPPHSIEAEQAVLGGLLLDNEAWLRIAGRVAEEDFYREDHRLIFRAIQHQAENNKPYDAVTLAEWLKSRGQLEEAGGLAYLGTLANETPSSANIMAYGDIVREQSVLRQLIGAGVSISEMGYTPQGRSTSELLNEAEKKVFAIAEQIKRGKQDFQSVGDVLPQVVSRIHELYESDQPLTGLSTGLTKFDEMTSGLQKGDLIIVAARPAMGKCLAWDSELVLDDGSVATIEDFFRRRDSRVATLRADYKLDRAAPSDYVDDGHKPVFEVRTRLGRRVETTLPHPFLTPEGWRPLAELRPGDFVAVPRQLPVFGHQPMRECEIKLLAYFIGDGGLTGTSPRFTTTNPAIERDFLDAVAEFGGCVCTEYRSSKRAPSFAVVADAGRVAARRARFALRLADVMDHGSRSARTVATQARVSAASLTYWRQGVMVPDAERFARLCRVLEVKAEDLAPEGLASARHNTPNAISRWLQEHGLNGKGAGAKEVPAAVFRLPRAQMATFLRHLFATDGWASVLASGQPQIGYATISERLARQVQHLLLRFGIIAKLRQRWVRYKDARRPSWQLDITDAASLRHFLGEIGIFAKGEATARVAAALDARRARTNVDLIPAAIWSRIAQAKGEMSWAELARRAGVSSSNIHAGRRALSRPRLARFAMVLGDPELAAIANSDVYWDRIESIVPAGSKQVYDLTIPDTHNFIANDVCVHNTSLAMNIVENVAIKHNVPTAIFSMEMSSTQLLLRMIASLGRIDQQHVRTGKLEDSEWPRFTSAVSLIEQARNCIFVDDSSTLSPTELHARARRMQRDHQIGLVVIDYLQLMTVPGTRENRTTEVSEISRSLKALARDLNVPVIALSQVSRKAETNPDNKPKMSDLRESGSIEQDADMVVFIHREEYYKPDSPKKGTAEIIIGKQRNGPTDSFEVAFLRHCTRFENLAADYYEEARG